MEKKLDQILDKTKLSLEKAETLKALEDIRISVLGKKGELKTILNGMGALDSEERPKIGKKANLVREQIERAIEQKHTYLLENQLIEQLKAEKIDVTLPGTKCNLGKRHPLFLVLDEIKEIFMGMGFEIVEGPEIETDYYNFEALNMPKDHPARDMQDTFYIDENTVLRTQTSPVQIRAMQSKTPPIKLISPGKVYRSDAVDATHSPLFNQIEGLVIGKNITFADLKGTLNTFVKRLYGDNAVTRLRPHHFRYTEPSAELDFMCFNCNGKGCRMCKGEGWVELLGCGMVHPQVLRNCNIDPEIYSGFAFGLGLERIAMRRFNVQDMRLFYENDIRFINQM